MEEFKVGDRVYHEKYGEGVIEELIPLAAVRITNGNNPFLFTFTSYLTKIKPKVKKWKWVIQNKYGLVQVTVKWYSSKEEIEKSIPGHTVLQKIDATERIDDE